MEKVILKDFEVRACHGVNLEEKINPQRFLITAVVYLDFEDAAKFDDVDKTVSYSAIKKDIKCFFEQNCFNLIETLAVRCTKMLLKKYDLAKRIDMTIKKPDAPMSGVFDYAGVEVSFEWHTAYLSLGSSLGDKNAYLDLAIERLKDDDNIKEVRESSRICTDPYGYVAREEFLNSAVELRTLYTPRQLLNKIGEIEKEGGRERKEHWADRTLDIDIIFYDDLVVEEKDLCIPHIDMQNRAFVLRPLHELCPYKVHPLLNKRVEDILRDLPDFCNVK